MVRTTDLLHYTTVVTHTVTGPDRRGFQQDPRIFFCEPGWSWAPAPLPDLDCWCVLEGEGRLNTGGETHSLRSGFCFLFAPGSKPTATHDPEHPLTVFAAHLDPRAPFGRASAGVPIPPVNEPILVEDTHRLRRLTGLVLDSVPLDSSFRCEEASLALRQLFHLLAHPDSRRSPADPRLDRVRQRVLQRLAHPWTVDDMAAVASLSPSRFNVLFKAHFGQSPNRYLIQARIDRAKALLHETRMSQQEIADALGYRDVYFFNRQFTKETGIPPGRWRDGSRRPARPLA